MMYNVRNSCLASKTGLVMLVLFYLNIKTINARLWLFSH